MTVRAALKVMVAIALWALIFYWVPLDELMASLAHAETGWVVLSLTLPLLVKGLTAYRMYCLARAQNLLLGMRDMLRVIFATAFYGLFLPGGAAGGAVTFAKYVQFGASPSAALTNLVVNKGLEVLAALYLGLVFFCFDHWGGSPWILLTAPLLLLFVVAALHGIVSRFGLWSSLCRVAEQRQWRLVPVLQRLESQLQRVQSLGFFNWLCLFLLAIGGILLAAAGMQGFAWALGLEISFAATLWIYCLLALLSLLPISFSNIGVREASLLVLAPAYGIPESQAIAWSIMMYGAVLTPALVGALTESVGRRKAVLQEPVPQA